MNLRNLLLYLTLLVLLLPACTKREDPLYEGFLQPGWEYRPRVWWHWMNGNITKDGIRKDLEWMDRAGIVGFHNFDAGMSTPQVVEHRLVYMTPEWKDAFRYALDLADSLDMEVSIASSPGWSITGGPWVTEDDAQKKLVWREFTLQGGCHVRQPLPEPITCCGQYQDIPLYPADPLRFSYYRDLNLLAVKLPDDQTVIPDPVMTVSDPQFERSLLNDGILGKNAALAPDGNGYSWIEFRYPQPVSLQSMFLAEFTGTPVSLEVDRTGDGTYETLVEEVPMSRIKTTTVRSYDFPMTKGVGFRIRAARPGQSLKVSEMSFSPDIRINLAEDKAGFLPNYLIYDNFPTPSATEAPSLKDVVDLSGFVTDGILDWDAPEGTWKIFRFGYNLQGNKNGPASPEATGLEVDKLNGEAIKRYYDHYLGLYQEASGGRLGKSVNCLMIDSYESGKGTWTVDMEKEFLTRRGYDLRPWMPVLTGMVLESSEKSEQFLFDWRTTLGELIAENHYDLVSDILSKYGMTRYTESHEWRKAFVGDGMMPKRKADIPMAAMWIHSTDEGRHSTYPSGDADIRESSSVAHIYGQNICAAESFTVDGRIGERNGLGAYQSSPSNLKPLADAMLAEGLNRYVIHTSVHQPVDDRIPGLGLGPYGQWFNRHDTWAEEARAWTDYLSRNCFMMQQGRWVADVAWFYGEDKNVTGMYIEDRIPVPKGYNFDLVNGDILLHELKVKDRCLVTKTGMRYRALVLDPDVKYISLSILERLLQFHKAGVPVIGPRPVGKAGLEGSEERFKSIVDWIWNEDNRPVKDKDGIRASLLNAGISPDADLEASGNADVRFVHRRLDDGELYWVANITPEYRDMTVSFRISGFKPEIWHPDSGRKETPSFRMIDGRTEVDLHFTPDDAQYILFRERTAEKRYSAPVLPESQMMVLSGPWALSFQPDRGAPAKVVYPILESLSESPVEGIRFFSGTVRYSSSFKVEEDQDISGNIILDLGEVHHMARVRLNGEDLGLAWKMPYRICIGGKVRQGENTLEIDVTDSWANRLIGDERKPADSRLTYTPERFYTEEDTPIPSGLLGPVKILRL